MMRTVILLVALLAVSPPALAQGHHTGDGAWIPANPAYVAASGTHCCGLDHCKPNRGEVSRVNGGWIHAPTMSILADGTKGIYPSEDAVDYFCAWGGELKCVFPATGG